MGTASSTLDVTVTVTSAETTPTIPPITYQTRKLSATGEQTFVLPARRFPTIGTESNAAQAYTVTISGSGSGTVSLKATTSTNADSGAASGINLTGNSGSIPQFKAVGHENTVPGLTELAIISSPYDETSYKAGERIEFLATLNSRVEFPDDAELKVQVGSNLRGATLVQEYRDGAGFPSYYWFAYTVVNDDVDSNGITVPANPFGDNADGAIIYKDSFSVTNAKIPADVRYAAIAPGSSQAVNGAAASTCVGIWCAKLTPGENVTAMNGGDTDYELGYAVEGPAGLTIPPTRFGEMTSHTLSGTSFDGDFDDYQTSFWELLHKQGDTVSPAFNIVFTSVFDSDIRNYHQDRLRLVAGNHVFDFDDTSNLVKALDTSSVDANLGVNLQDGTETDLRIVEGAEITISEDQQNASLLTKEEGETIGILVGVDPVFNYDVTLSLEAEYQNGASAADVSFPASIDIAAGEKEVSFDLEIVDDVIDDVLDPADPLESVIIKIADDPHVTNYDDSEFQVNIEDNDTRAAIGLSERVLFVDEGEELTVTVESDTPLAKRFSVPFTITPGGGATAADYTSASSSFDLDLGGDGSVVITALADGVDDGNEWLDITLGAPPAPAYVGSSNTAKIYIGDPNDPEVTAQVENSIHQVLEDTEPTFHITLSEDPERFVRVLLAFTAQNGAGAGDWRDETFGERVDFLSGETRKPYTIRIQNDNAHDSGESVRMDLSLPIGMSRVTLGDPSSSTVYIVDPMDPEVEVEFGSTTYEVDEGGIIQVEVELSADPDRPVFVPITATGMAGATDEDFILGETFASFDDGVTSDLITFTPRQDFFNDDDETVTLGFGTLPPKVSAGTDSTTTITIDDDDVPSRVIVDEHNFYVEEGKTVDVTFTATPTPELDITIPINVARRGGATAADYSVADSITFTAGSNTASLTVTANADSSDDGGEYLELSFGTGPPEAEYDDRSFGVHIIDPNDPEVTIQFGSAYHQVLEGGNATFTVTLSADPERRVVVPLDIMPEDGANVSDYEAEIGNDLAVLPGRLTFEKGETSKTFKLGITVNMDSEEGGQIKMALGDLPPRVTKGTPGDSIVYIIDSEDPAITASFGAATYSAAEGGTVEVTVTLNADPDRTVVVPITGTPMMMADDEDYSLNPDYVKFADNVTSGTFTFSATQDESNDDDETVQLGFGTLPHNVTAGSTATTTVSIVDDDLPTAVSFGSDVYFAAEGMSVDFHVELDRPATETVTFPITTSFGNGANAQALNLPGTQSVTFQSGEDRKTRTVQTGTQSSTNHDQYMEMSFGTLPSREYRVGDVSTTRVYKVDSNAPRVDAQFESGIVQAEEGNDATFTVTLSADPLRLVRLPIVFTPEDGSDADDFGAPSGETDVPEYVEFNSGVTSATISIGIVDNTAADTEEGGIIKASIPSGNQLPPRVDAGDPRDSRVYITDADDPSVNVSFGASTYTVDEGDTLDINVTLSADADRRVFIPLTATPQSGATEGDFSLSTTLVEFADGGNFEDHHPEEYPGPCSGRGGGGGAQLGDAAPEGHFGQSLDEHRNAEQRRSAPGDLLRGRTLFCAGREHGDGESGHGQAACRRGNHTNTARGHGRGQSGRLYGAQSFAGSVWGRREGGYLYSVGGGQRLGRPR